VILIESLTLRIMVMAFYIFSSSWAPAGQCTLCPPCARTRTAPYGAQELTQSLDYAVVTGVLRVVSAGVCSDWYAGHAGPVRSNPTLFYAKQSMTSSFNAITVASLVGFDLRTTRASLVAYRYRAPRFSMPCASATCRAHPRPPSSCLCLCRKSCCSCFGSWVNGIDRIIPYCNRYAFSQVRPHTHTCQRWCHAHSLFPPHS
jgi:hypothetical protein